MTTGGWHLAAVNPRAAALGLSAGDLLADARARVPSLQHDRPFALPLPLEEKSAAE